MTVTEPMQATLTNTSSNLSLSISGAGLSNRVVRLSAAKCTIGAAPNCTLRLIGPGVRPMHCMIIRGVGGTFVRRWAPDTLLNGEVFEDAPLVEGDRLTIGPLQLDVIAPSDDDAPQSAPNRAEAKFLSPAVAPSSPSRQPRTTPSDRPSTTSETGSDIAAELNRRLKQQRQRSRKLLAQLRNSRQEITELQQGIDASNDVRRELQNQLGEITLQLQSNRGHAAEQWDRLTASAVQLESDNKTLQAKCTTLEADVAARRNELQQEKAKVEVARSEQQKLQGEIANLQQQQAATSQTQQKSQGEVREKLAAAEKRNEQAEQQAAKLQHELDSVLEELNSTNEKMIAQRHAQDNLQRQLDDEQAHATQAQQQVDSLNESLQQLQQQKQDAAKAEEQVSAESAELKKTKATLDEAQAKLYAQTQQLELLRTEVQAGKDEVAAARQELAQQQTELNQRYAEFEAQRAAWEADVDRRTSHIADDIERPVEPIDEHGQSDDGGAAAEAAIERLRELSIWDEKPGEADSHHDSYQRDDHATATALDEAAQSPSEPDEDFSVDDYESSDQEQDGESPATDEDPFGLASSNEQASGEDGDDEESIEDYMARLMQRVHGDPSEAVVRPTPPKVNKPQPTVKVAPAAEEKKKQQPAAATPQKAFRLEDIRRTISLPERSGNFAAMRELANASAKSDISTYTSKCSMQQAVSYMVVSGVCFAAGVAIFLLSDAVMSITSIGGIFAGLGALYFGTRGALQFLTLAGGGDRHPVQDHTDRDHHDPILAQQPSTQPPASSNADVDADSQSELPPEVDVCDLTQEQFTPAESTPPSGSQTT